MDDDDDARERRTYYTEPTANNNNNIDMDSLGIDEQICMISNVCSVSICVCTQRPSFGVSRGRGRFKCCNRRRNVRARTARNLPRSAVSSIC